MNVFLIIGLIFIVFMGADRFFRLRAAQQRQMRAEQRANNLEGWKKLGFF
jgi:hypothetical protein